jgi:hypothetical protein
MIGRTLDPPPTPATMPPPPPCTLIAAQLFGTKRIQQVEA